MVGISAQGTEWSTVIDFMSISAVVDTEDFAFFEKREVALKPVVNGLGDLEAGGGIFEERGVWKVGGGLPDFVAIGIEKEFFQFVIEDADGEGVEKFVRNDKRLAIGFF